MFWKINQTTDEVKLNPVPDSVESDLLQHLGLSARVPTEFVLPTGRADAHPSLWMCWIVLLSGRSFVPSASQQLEVLLSHPTIMF